LNQFSVWQKYTSMYHLPSARKTAQSKATQQNKRYKITDSKGTLVDLLYP